jgi:tetratricopeptide (TPR) repeat protein
MRPRTERMIAIALFVGAFAVRLAFILQTRKLPFYYHPVLDSGFFDQWAALKKTATWFELSPAFREPLYAYFLGGVYTVLGQSLTLARLVQAVLAGFTCLLIYSLTRAIYGRLAGIVAGVVFAFATPLVFFAAELNETTFLIFLLVSSAYLLLRAGQSRPYLNAGLAGLLLGASFLTRVASVAALPAWATHLALAKNARVKKAVLALAVGFIILPIIYQAVLVRANEHPLVPLRAAWHAFLGSGRVGATVAEARYDVPISQDQGEYRAVVAGDRMDGGRDALRFARIETGQPRTFGQSSAHWRSRAFKSLASDPGKSVKAYLTKLGVFWGPSEPPANIDMRFMARYSWLLKNALFSFAVIAPLGIVGLLRRGRKLIGLALFVVLYSLLASFYLISDSDKAVVLPFLAVFGATVVSEVALGANKVKPGRAAALAASVLVAGVLLYLLPHSNVDQARQQIILGDICREEAIFDKAEAAYRQAIDLSPESPDAYVALSQIYSTAWKGDQALGVLALAKGQAARDPRLIIEKASLLYAQKKPDEAMALLRDVEARYPYEPRLHELIGINLLAKGDVAGSRAALEKEIDYAGGGFVTYAALGKSCLLMGEFGTATDYLEMASRLNSSDTGVAMQLADAYGRLDQYLKACEVLSRVLGIDPGNLPLRFKFANSLYHAGRYGDALKQFKELATFDPKNADVLVNMGTVYAAMDSTSQAIGTWERALTLDPKNQLARENLKAMGR